MTKPMSCVLGLAIVIATGLPYYVIFVVKPFKMDILDRFSGKFLFGLNRYLKRSIAIMQLTLSLATFCTLKADPDRSTYN